VILASEVVARQLCRGDNDLPYRTIGNWERSSEESFLDKVRGIFSRKAPPKDRIAICIYRLKAQKAEIATLVARMEQRDREFFARCVAAQMSKESARATMYANECAEVRKMARLTLRCEFALEQTILRLETVEELGDVAAIMGPATGVIQAIRTQVQGIMPQVSFELGMISETLNDVALEVGEASAPGYDITVSSEQAQSILTEASAIAEVRMRERFPELPTPAVRTPSEKAIS
jgi:division protein CdvB (Snf7/Vps24/ESCRT-III family)